MKQLRKAGNQGRGEGEKKTCLRSLGEGLYSHSYLAPQVGELSSFGDVVQLEEDKDDLTAVLLVCPYLVGVVAVSLPPKSVSCPPLVTWSNWRRIETISQLSS
ncbi:hypothetical protein PTKIN_Ptkin04bG0202400 [Pterospermum kingtungense]